MKCKLQKITGCIFVLAASVLAFLADVAGAQTTLPSHLNTSKSCHVKSDTARLMNSAKIGKAPDNLNFKAEADPCNFYERAEQMFLWLTSPLPSPHRRGAYVFNSPMFLNAWSADASARSLVPLPRDANRRSKMMLDVKIDLEPGQAGRDTFPAPDSGPESEQAHRDAPVLMTQDNRLVYYLVEVNDVFAYFLTGQRTGEIEATHFPGKQTELDDIKKFARSHGKTLADANALVVELKSAWIETAGFKKSDLRKYITMEATIPIYAPSPSSPTTTLIPKGFQKRQLALLGMHVVFSANGHPEMLWATFEHINNTRDRGYRYFDEREKFPKMQCAEPKGHWVFSRRPDTECTDEGSFNDATMHFDSKSGNIVAYEGKTIAPSNVRRESPWGGDPEGSAADSTQVISINQQVHDLLARHDVRKNYILVGTTWTRNGEPPAEGNQAGTTKLVNTTLETFFRSKGGNTNGVSNCFDCHKGNMLGDNDRTGLSHMFGVLPPLECPPGNPCSPPGLVDRR